MLTLTKPKIFSKSLHRLTLLLLSLLICLLATLLLREAGPVGEGIRRGLTICTTVVIPSLFPFMVLAGFLSLSPVCALLAKPLTPITKGLLHLPPEMGTVVLMSFIGGYPVGARLISSLLEQGRLDRDTASRMLCFCVNAGPSFLIGAVGVALFGSVEAGVCLLVAQVLSALVVGALLSRKTHPRYVTLRESFLPPTQALVQGVTGAAYAMLMVCAFVTLFSAVSALLQATGALPWLCTTLARRLPFVTLDESFYNALFTGLLEVTGGCVAAASLAPRTAFLLTAFLVSFGGVSILCQVAASFAPGSVSLRPLLLSRLACGALSSLIAYPLYQRFCAGQMVYATATPPILVVSPQSAILAILMIGMCAIVLLTLATCPWKQPMSEN